MAAASLPPTRPGPPNAIPTRYGGCLFRSRLEARHALYFDCIRLKWMYEPEGFDLGSLGWYLPDFYFPGLGCRGEVKPATFTEREFRKAAAVGCCLLFDDQPTNRLWFATNVINDWEPSTYRDYMRGIQGDPNYGRIHLPTSVYKGRLWLSLGEDNYGDPVDAAVEMARSARFNGYPAPGEEPFNLTDREMREERNRK